MQLTTCITSEHAGHSGLPTARKPDATNQQQFVLFERLLSAFAVAVLLVLLLAALVV